MVGRGQVAHLPARKLPLSSVLALNCSESSGTFQIKFDMMVICR